MNAFRKTTRAARLATGRALGALAFAAMAFGAVLPPAHADPDKRATVDGIHASMDTDGNGVVDAAEYAAYTQLVFLSMDANRDGAVDGAEYMEWDAGLDWLAAQRGRAEDYARVKHAVFALYWDIDGNGRMVLPEALAIAALEFRGADRDGDGLLNAPDLGRGTPTLAALLSI